VLKRLKGIEGQVRGFVRMVENDRYCTDICHTAVGGARGRAPGRGGDPRRPRRQLRRARERRKLLWPGAHSRLDSASHDGFGRLPAIVVGNKMLAPLAIIEKVPAANPSKLKLTADYRKSRAKRVSISGGL